MKVIIRNETTHLYATETGDWTANAAGARNFAFSLQAISVAQSLGLKNYQVLFYFPLFNYELAAGGSLAPSVAPQSVPHKVSRRKLRQARRLTRANAKVQPLLPKGLWQTVSSTMHNFLHATSHFFHLGTGGHHRARLAPAVARAR